MRFTIQINIMASLKDKLKSKIKSRAQVEVMESFDQTSLNVTLIQGKNQLSQMKVCSSWIAKTNAKLPKFKCKWYNRTENNYQEIVGIQDEVYQPSIADVDSIVEVTCIPQIAGVNYEGMPFLLKSKPIALSPDTEAEANKMLDSGKVRLIVSIKSAKIKGTAVAPGNQGMLVIQKQKLTLSEVKFGQINDHILKTIDIDDAFPQIIINRRIPRQIYLKFNAEENCILLFKSHQIRDSFYLYFQLFNANKAFKKELQKQQPNKQPESTCQTIDKQPSSQQCIKQEIAENQRISETKQNEKSEQKLQSSNVQSSNQKIQEAVQQIQQQTKAQAPKLPQVRQSKLQQGKKVQQKVTFKQNTSELLQSIKLKEEIKRLEQQNIKLTKQCEQQKNKVIDLQLKIQQFNERLSNASVNYFTLQKQLKNKQAIVLSLQRELDKNKDVQNSKLQELIYYRNQINLLKDQNHKLKQSNASLLKQFQECRSEVSFYKEKYINKDSLYSYKQLFQELNSYKQAQKELKLKYQFQVQQKEKIEESLRDSRHLIQKIQSEKKHIQKKYQSLTSELVSNSISPSIVSKYSERFSERSLQASLTGSFVLEDLPSLEKSQSLVKKMSSQHDFREKEILQLKKQLKSYVEENNLLRALIQKEKKSTSRAHLKVELIDAKKIVSRLSETIGEKQMNISQLKEINKELNKKNQQLEQKIAILGMSKG